MQVILETERLLLKSITKADGERLYDFLMRNYEFFKPWSPLYEEDYDMIEHHTARAEYHEKDAESGKGIKFGLCKKEEPQKIIGTAALSNIIKGPFLSCFLGYRVDEKENGKGYATEGIKRAVEYAFIDLKLHRIEANIIPRNKASVRVVEKLGFTYEGLSKKYLQINGVWEDHLHYVLLNENIE
jgi:ribosomal-protein-alanine N-acetyltransferase